MLEKKEKVLEKKAAAELERAKEFSKAKNKRGVAYLHSASCIIYFLLSFDLNWIDV
jgi:hypothetical protein